MLADTTVSGGGIAGTPEQVAAPSQLAFTVVISATPPTAPSGGVSLDRVGIDTAGNIWLMPPKTTISGVTAGGWSYAATVTAGGLPLAE
jgi:hypothetical protein